MKNRLFNPAKFMATLTKKLPVRASTAFRIAGVAVTVALAGLALSAGSERSSAPSGSSQPAGRNLADSTKHGIAPGTYFNITSPANLKLSNQPGAPTIAPYTVGDVFVGVGTGFIKHFSPAGVLLDTLNTLTGCNEDFWRPQRLAPVPAPVKLSSSTIWATSLAHLAAATAIQQNQS